MQAKIWKVGVLWAVALVLVVGIYSATHAVGPRPIRVVVEGTTLNVSSQIVNGRVMVPYRAVAERLGARVGWNAAERSVTVTDGDKTLKLTVGQTNAIINGRIITLDAAPVLRSGRVLVPLRFLGTGLGWRVSWEGDTRTARLNSIPDLTVRVVVPDGVPALSIIRLLRERPSMGRNVKISYEVVRSPELMAARVISGEADIAIVSTNLAAVLYNRNVPYKLAAANVWGVLHLVSSENIRSWQDLRGKEVHTFGRGLTPDIVFRYLLSENGLNPERDVTLRYLGSGTELAQAMIAGRVRTAVLPEPAATQVIMRRPDVSPVLDLQQAWAMATGLGLSYPQASLLISNALLNGYPEFVERFLSEVAQSAEWVNNNRNTAGVWAEELQTGMTARVVENALPRANIRFVNAREARAAIEAYLRVLRDFSPETVGGRLPSETFYFQR
ncbi:MAG: ABC transporter substrate-binding protein [Dethiobacter sp.]|nr:ABC transporter substrate-binding protein [Dethiobacter sp.]MBS3990350.1 ABC transporter substrate-binding protein [Dethiobacter sp.]